MKRFLGLAGIATFVGLLPVSASAAAITYRYQHHIYTVEPLGQAAWKSPSEKWFYKGAEIEPAPEWRTDGDTPVPLPDGVERRSVVDWNRDAIGATLDRVIGADLARPAGSVTIKKSSSGAITFEGAGLTGRALDTDAATSLTIEALQKGIVDIELPVRETQPHITVTDPSLKEMGITEVVTIGESDFTGSPVNRRHNIGVGLARFNGQLIKAGATFSFNQVLGKVDGSTGYRKELVIKGDRTEPDYGGGLCQISSTAYRGVWEYGLPILKRRNHSYLVHYYSPSGTDATVYPGAVDMVFKNDMPTALLIQTYQQNSHAYFIYYGTRDTRTSEVVGPFVLSRTQPPPDREELTTDLAPGERKKLNERVPGSSVLWYRFVTGTDGKEKSEKVSSLYEARPLFYAVGVATLPETQTGPLLDEAQIVDTGSSSSR
jgi:vancomycin resistance protein YoaR